MFLDTLELVEKFANLQFTVFYDPWLFAGWWPARKVIAKSVARLIQNDLPSDTLIVVEKCLAN